MSDRETAIAMFMREHGATSHRLREDGVLILTRGSGRKIKQLRVTASQLSQVEERVRTHVVPFRYELQATLLGGAKAPAKGKKRDSGKRIR